MVGIHVLFHNVLFLATVMTHITLQVIPLFDNIIFNLNSRLFCIFSLLGSFNFLCTCLLGPLAFCFFNINLIWWFHLISLFLALAFISLNSASSLIILRNIFWTTASVSLTFSLRSPSSLLKIVISWHSTFSFTTSSSLSRLTRTRLDLVYGLPIKPIIKFFGETLCFWWKPCFWWKERFWWKCGLWWKHEFGW